MLSYRLEEGGIARSMTSLSLYSGSAVIIRGRLRSGCGSPYNLSPELYATNQKNK